MPLGAAVPEQGGHVFAYQPLGNHRLRLHIRHGQIEAQRRLIPQAGRAFDLRLIVLSDFSRGGEVLDGIPGLAPALRDARRPELGGDIGIVVFQPHAVGAGLGHGLVDLLQRAPVSLLLLRENGGKAVPDRLGAAVGDTQIVLQSLGEAVNHPGFPGLIDLLQLGEPGGQLLAAVAALQLIQRRHIAGSHIVQPILQLLRGGGLERIQLPRQDAEIHLSAQTVLPQVLYVGAEDFLFRRAAVLDAQVPPGLNTPVFQELLGLLRVVQVLQVEGLGFLLPEGVRRVPDGVVLTVALPGGFVKTFQRPDAADVRAGSHIPAGGAHRGAGAAAEARLGRAGGDLAGEVAGACPIRNIHHNGLLFMPVCPCPAGSRPKY